MRQTERQIEADPKPLVIQAVCGRHSFPGVFDKQPRDEVFGLLGDAVELFCVEVPRGGGDVGQRFLFRVPHEGRQPRQPVKDSNPKPDQIIRYGTSYVLFVAEQTKGIKSARQTWDTTTET